MRVEIEGYTFRIRNPFGKRKWNEICKREAKRQAEEEKWRLAREAAERAEWEAEARRAREGA